jgi:hypothetical protein
MSLNPNPATLAAVSPTQTHRTVVSWMIGAAAGALLVSLNGCAAGSSESSHSVSGGLLAQFLLGVWHGVIAPATLLLEVVNRIAPALLPWSAHFYESRGTGVEYDAGFYLGLTGSPLFAWSRWSGRSSSAD